MGEGNPMSRDQTHAGLTASLKHPRIDLLGVGISDTNPDDVVRTVGYWLDHGCNRYICVTPVSGVMAAQRNPAVMGVLNESGLTARPSCGPAATQVRSTCVGSTGRS